MVTNGTKMSSEERRNKVARLYLLCHSLREIGRKIGVHHATVARDLVRIRKEWSDARISDYNRLVDETLQRIDTLESEAWQAWERSQRDRETLKTSEFEDGKTKTDKTTEGQAGDPRFLAIIDKCIERRARILGVEKPDEIERAQREIMPIRIEFIQPPASGNGDVVDANDYHRLTDERGNGNEREAAG